MWKFGRRYRLTSVTQSQLIKRQSAFLPGAGILVHRADRSFSRTTGVAVELEQCRVRPKGAPRHHWGAFKRTSQSRAYDRASRRLQSPNVAIPMGAASASSS